MKEKEKPSPVAENGRSPRPSQGRRRLLCAGIVVIAIGLVAVAWIYFPRTMDGGAPRLRSRLNYDNPWQIEAVSLADQLVKDFPEDPQTLLLRGLILNRFVSHDDAIRCWQACLERSPKCADAYYWLGTETLRKGNYQEAVANYRLAWELGSEQADVRIQLADTLFNLGRFEESVPALKEQVRLAPQVTAGFYYLAQACFQMKRMDDAVYYYRWALDTNPKCSQAWLGLAQISQNRGEPEKADNYLRQFRDLQTTSFAEQQDKKRAFDDEQSLEGALATAYTDAATFYLSGDDVATAEIFWTRAAELDRQNTQCRMRLVDLYNEQQRSSDMLRMLVQLQEIEPLNPSHCLRQALLNMTLAQFDQAEQAFSRLIELTPDRTEGYAGLARLYLAKGVKFKESLTFAQQAVQTRPDAENFFLLSKAFAANGDLAGSIKAIAQAVELAPDNQEYRAFQQEQQDRAGERQ